MANQCNLQPLADRVVIKPIEEDTTTASGIVLTDTSAERPSEGEVIAVGPGRVKNGEQMPIDVTVGDRVLFSKYSPTEVKVEGEELLIVSQKDILAIIK